MPPLVDVDVDVLSLDVAVPSADVDDVLVIVAVLSDVDSEVVEYYSHMCPSYSSSHHSISPCWL